MPKSEALMDHVLRLDKQQNLSNPEARRCKTNPDHGLLTATGDGTALVCGKMLGKDRFCGYGEPVSIQ